MKQHRFAAGGSVLQFLPPLANEFPHIGLGSAEFLNLPAERTQLLFRQIEYAMAGYAAMVASSQNLGKFTKREAELERPLCKLNALDSRRREYAISPTRPLRSGKNADPFVVAERISADARKTGEFSRAQSRSTHSKSMHPRIVSRVKLFLTGVTG